MPQWLTDVIVWAIDFQNDAKDFIFGVVAGTFLRYFLDKLNIRFKSDVDKKSELTIHKKKEQFTVVRELYSMITRLRTMNNKIGKYGIRFGLMLQYQRKDKDLRELLSNSILRAIEHREHVEEYYMEKEVDLTEQQFMLAEKMTFLSKMLHINAKDLLTYFGKIPDKYMYNGIRKFDDSFMDISQDFSQSRKELKETTEADA